MDHIDQSYKELKYYFFSKPYGLRNLERLGILVKKKINLKNGFTLEVAIIGASHFWLLWNAQGQLVAAEVMACVSGFDFGEKEMFSFSGSVLRTTDIDSVNLMNLQMKYNLKVFFNINIGDDSEDFENPLIDIEFTFPGDTKTKVMVYELDLEMNKVLKEGRPRYLIKTIHDYPENKENFQVLSLGTLVLI